MASNRPMATSTLTPIESSDGPGCGHAVCLLERTCVLVQAERELLDHRADRAHRLHVGRTLAHCLGLGGDEGRLLEVVAYSPDLGCRIAAADMLVAALCDLTGAAA